MSMTSGSSHFIWAMSMTSGRSHFKWAMSMASGSSHLKSRLYSENVGYTNIGVVCTELYVLNMVDGILNT